MIREHLRLIVTVFASTIVAIKIIYRLCLSAGRTVFDKIIIYTPADCHFGWSPSPFTMLTHVRKSVFHSTTEQTLTIHIFSIMALAKSPAKDFLSTVAMRTILLFRCSSLQLPWLLPTPYLAIMRVAISVCKVFILAPLKFT